MLNGYRNMVLNAIKTTGILNRFTLGAAIYNYFLFGDMAQLKYVTEPDKLLAYSRYLSSI